ncbi:hypothetical protein [Cupriavidus necator]|uniref:hypothetical protein n=1 Tax=Cupriavidus necator TaxID=106590 RepID=UPI00339D7CD9
MSIEMLVLAVEDVLVSHVRKERCDTVRTLVQMYSANNQTGFERTHEDAFLEDCSTRSLEVSEQAVRLLMQAQTDGVRLGLVSRMSSRMLCALLDQAVGPDWVDWFNIVATADALSPGQSDADLFDLILRTADVPADRAILVDACPRALSVAQRLGMGTVTVLDNGALGADPAVSMACETRSLAWPQFRELEEALTQREAPLVHERRATVC